MSFFRKVNNVLAVLLFVFLWTITVAVAINKLFSINILKDISVSATPIFLSGLSGSISWLKPVYFISFILAPLWEEFIFRKAPLDFAIGFLHQRNLIDRLYYKIMNADVMVDSSMRFNPENVIDYKIKNGEYVLVTAIFSSIIFGILHGSVFNILIQGVVGASFCWLYLANQRSYWSVVICHSLLNGTLFFFFG